MNTDSFWKGMAFGFVGALAVAGSGYWILKPPTIEAGLTGALCTTFVVKRNETLKSDPRAKVELIPDSCSAYLVGETIRGGAPVVTPSVREGCLQELTGAHSKSTVENDKDLLGACRAWLKQ